MRKKLVKKAGKYFDVESQHRIIQELLSSGSTKRAIWKKYTGQDEEHGQLLRWMNKLGYTNPRKEKPGNLASKARVMPEKQKREDGLTKADASFEQLQLKKRIFELEKQLKEAELKAIAYSTMVDIAEAEFKIPIRKKYNTKP